MKALIIASIVIASTCFKEEALAQAVAATTPAVRVTAVEEEAPTDGRLEALTDLNSYFPFDVPKTEVAWEKRADELRRRVLVANGLWPMPERTPLNPVIHGKAERDGFTVEKVYFESVPGFYVTGLLFRPETVEEGTKLPAVLSPHGHGGRLQDHGPTKIRDYIVKGEERFEQSGRFPKVARCAQLARMGVVTLLFDMIGYGDNHQLSYELGHRFAEPRTDLDQADRWGFYSTHAELRLQSIMGLQTWNAIRALDFLSELPDVDPNRIAVTGGSGGGTQTILLCAIDPRPVAAFPQGMVSTSMQGGCTCENTALLRIGTGNVELAGLFAPNPQAMTAANDWTKAMMSEGYPSLKKLYQLYDAEEMVQCKSTVHFPHNYNYVTRGMMYTWFNKHLQLGLQEPIVEEDFQMLTGEEHAVWDTAHPKPADGVEFEVALTKYLAKASDAKIGSLSPKDVDGLAAYCDLMGGAWKTLIGRGLPREGDLEQDTGDQTTHEGYLESVGVIRLPDQNEQVPVTVFLPTENITREFVLWVDGRGKAAALTAEGGLSAALQSLVKAGRTVILTDVFQLGLLENRVVANKRAYAGYTFGYNHPLFAQRVHDLLTIIGAATEDAESLDLVGVNGAGPWVAVASALAGEAVRRTAIDDGRFRFAQVSSYRDANFLPGALKYGDLPGALALCAPRPLWIGQGGNMDTTQVAYQAAGARDALIVSNVEQSEEPILEWILAAEEENQEESGRERE